MNYAVILALIASLQKEVTLLEAELAQQQAAVATTTPTYAQNEVSDYQNAIYSAWQAFISKENAQQAQMQSELNPIQNQIQTLNAQIASQCSGLVTGGAFRNCSNLQLQEQDLTNQENVIIDNYSFQAGTPVYAQMQNLPLSYLQITSSNGGESGTITGPWGSQVYQFSCSSFENCTMFSE
jgi:hypothetical protein